MDKFLYCSYERLQKSSGQSQVFDRITVEKNAFTTTPSPPNANQLLHQDHDARENEAMGPVKSPTGQQMEPAPTYKHNRVTLKLFVYLSLHFSSSRASEEVKHTLVYEFGIEKSPASCFPKPFDWCSDYL